MSKAARQHDDSAWHVGLIGLGSIARNLCSLLAEDAEITVLLRPGSSSLQSLPPGIVAVTSVEDLLRLNPDVVVEGAGQQAAAEIVPQVIKAGVPVVLVSVGCLADADLLSMLMREAEAADTRLIVPAGAIGGLDYLGALQDDPEAAVEYTSRKPLTAWTTEELASAKVDQNGELLLFEGAAWEAALRYPRNLNVAATIALAGVGMARTTVRVVADPAVSENTHEIVTESRLGHALLRFANTPSPVNPKTSALTAHTIRHSLNRLRSRLLI